MSVHQTLYIWMKPHKPLHQIKLELIALGCQDNNHNQKGSLASPLYKCNDGKMRRFGFYITTHENYIAFTSFNYGAVPIIIDTWLQQQAIPWNTQVSHMIENSIIFKGTLQRFLESDKTAEEVKT